LKKFTFKFAIAFKKACTFASPLLYMCYISCMLQVKADLALPQRTHILQIFQLYCSARSIVNHNPPGSFQFLAPKFTFASRHVSDKTFQHQRFKK